MVGRSFLPNEDMGEFQLVIDTPEGTSLQGMEKIAARADAEAAGARRASRTSCRRSSSASTTRTSSSSCKPLGERKLTQDQIADERPHADGAASRATSRRSSMRTPIGGGESSSYPIQLNLMGPDLRQLSGYALQRARRRAARCRSSATRRRRSTCATPSCASPSIVSAPPTSACAIGDLARALRLMVSGEDEISSYRENGRALSGEDPRARGSALRHADAIGGLMVPSARGEPVRVDNVAHARTRVRSRRSSSASTASSRSRSSPT